jgi:hypothetical protein
MISKLLRRSHMYLALFLTPWMLVYALSTMGMNHRQYFTKRGDNPSGSKRKATRPRRASFRFKPQPGRWRCSSSRVSTLKEPSVCREGHRVNG